MLQEMAGLGFSHVELSHGVRLTLAPGVLRAVEAGVVKISSCHNFCPLPPGVVHAAPNLFEPSAVGHRERLQWVRQTKRSIDFAAQVGARVLVCHLGHVDFFWFSPLSKVRRYLRDHPRARLVDDPAWAVVRERALVRLRARRARHWPHVLDCIREVLGYAVEKGITLGFENREALDELPLDEDFAELFASLPTGAPVGYWHDAGHAAIKESLGILDYEAHLARNAEHLVGWHLHDVDAERRDHRPIGAGLTDFRKLSRFWKPEHALVLELSPGVPVESVIASRERIAACLPV
jgi:sugar phosphate isomerase/epimerase